MNAGLIDRVADTYEAVGYSKAMHKLFMLVFDKVMNDKDPKRKEVYNDVLAMINRETGAEE